MKTSRLKALVNLLDDPDHLVFNTVKNELLKTKTDIIPILEEKWEQSYDELFQERIGNLIQDVQFKETRSLLKKWIDSESNDLLEGFLIIDRFQYPDINRAVILQKIEKINKTVWLELNNSLTMLEKATILNHFLYSVHSFSVNHAHPKSPQNCYINQILQTKRGNPVSISLLYTILARRLGLPAQLTDFPKNPLVAIIDSDISQKVHSEVPGSKVLFYINPSNKGSVASRKEVEYYLKKNEYIPCKKYTEPKKDQLFIKRLIESLRDSYLSQGFTDKKIKTDSLLNCFPAE